MRRWHAVTGVVPLAAYLMFHLWEHWPILRGAAALRARLDRTAGTSGAAVLELLFVVLPLILHGVLGWRLRHERDEVRAYASVQLRRLQLYSGLFLGLFLLWHLAIAWLPRWWGPVEPAREFQAMVDVLGSFPSAVFFVLGLSATCLHLAQGLPAAAAHLAPGWSAQRLRPVGIVVGAGWWLASMNVLAGYVAGAGLF